MDEAVAIKLETNEQFLVAILGSVAAFAAEHFARKGVTKFLLSRKV